MGAGASCCPHTLESAGLARTSRTHGEKNQTRVTTSSREPVLSGLSEPSSWKKGKTVMSKLIIIQVEFAQSCSMVCKSMDYSPPGFSVHGILQQEYWSVLPFPSPGDFPDPGIKLKSPTLTGRIFTAEPPRKPHSIIGACEYTTLIPEPGAKSNWTKWAFILKLWG